MKFASRRTFLSVLGAGTATGLAGCLGRDDLDVWVRNDLEDPIDYEITVEDFEESGSLDSDTTDRFEEVVSHPGTGEEIDMEVRFGFRAGDEFIEMAAGAGTFQVSSDTEAAFARINDLIGAVYGLSEAE